MGAQTQGDQIDGLTRLSSSPLTFQEAPISVRGADLEPKWRQMEPKSFAAWLQNQQKVPLSPPDLIRSTKKLEKPSHENDQPKWLASYISKRMQLPENKSGRNKSYSPAKVNEARLLLVCSAFNLLPSKLKALMSDAAANSSSDTDSITDLDYFDAKWDFELNETSQNDKLMPIPIDFLEVQLEGKFC